MELYRPRSSSIPRHLRQLPVHERFTVTDAAQLKLTLQALDDKLDRDVDVEVLRSACQPRPFHEEIYVAGSEEFYLLVKGIGRPDLIPDMYIDAYHTVQQGRFPTNRYKVSDFRKGVDATFSEVRALLPRIDQVCGTKLDRFYRALENELKTFPFLTLPAELRLQIYSHLLPREAHLAVLQQPNPERRPPRISLDILRINRQLYEEVTKHFYQGRTLFMVAAREQISGPLSDEFLLRYYETIAAMSPAARENFTKMEIQIGFLNDQTFNARRYLHVKRVSDPLRQIFKLLPNITTVVISTRSLPPLARTASSRWFSQRPDTMMWLLGDIPQSVQVQYARVGPHGSEKDCLEDETLRGLLEARGPVVIGESLLIYGGILPTKDVRVFYEFPGGT